MPRKGEHASSIDMLKHTLPRKAFRAAMAIDEYALPLEQKATVFWGVLRRGFPLAVSQTRKLLDPNSPVRMAYDNERTELNPLIRTIANRLKAEKTIEDTPPGMRRRAEILVNWARLHPDEPFSVKRIARESGESYSRMWAVHNNYWGELGLPPAEGRMKVKKTTQKEF